MAGRIESIEHDGIVQRSDSNSVTVSIISSAACSGCHAESICSMAGNEVKTIEIPGFYKVHPGERVTIRMKQSQGHAAVFLGYIMPLILLVTILVTLVSLSVSELTAGLGAMAILVPYYLVLYLLRNRLSRKFIFTLKT